MNGLPVAAHDSPRKFLKLHQRFEHRKYLAKRRALLLERALDLLERNRVNEVMSSRSPATTSAPFRASAWAEALLGLRLSARTGIPRRRRLRRDLMGVHSCSAQNVESEQQRQGKQGVRRRLASYDRRSAISARCEFRPAD